MTLSELKQFLGQKEQLQFMLPNGSMVPAHAHVTEIGALHKHFIDCGGNLRDEFKVSAQLWVSVDTDHRLKADKLLRIIQLAEEKAGITEGEIEVEYQGTTIQRFGLEAAGEVLLLTNRQTACLAEDQCGIPAAKEKRSLSDLGKAATCCTPGGTCC